MNATTEGLRSSFAMLDAMLDANLAEIDAAKASLRPAENANNAHWVVGHIVFWRSRILEMLGSDPVWADSEATEFRGMMKGDPPGELPVGFDDVRAALGLSRDRLRAALEAGVPDEVAGDVSSLALHEAYHVGQVGLLRRSMGLAGAIGG